MNARRYFLDLNTEGEVILSAPPRTSFESQGGFPWQSGKTAIEPPPGFNMENSRTILGGFRGCIELEGRLFFVSIQSVPVERIEG